MSASSLSTPTSVSSLASYHQLGDIQAAGQGMQHELEIIHSWFSMLSEAERTAAFASVAELTLVREIEPLIQTLKLRKRELWRQQESLALQFGDGGKKKMPSFPHGSKDPKWLNRWLRALRLHKYETNLAGLSPGEVSGLGDEDLQRLGIDTLGARKKLLRAIANGRTAERDIDS